MAKKEGNSLFDFIKVLFENPKSYKKISNYDKAKFFFMTNRFMSIMYPMQANAFNNIKITQSVVLDYWQKNMTNIYNKVPKWIFVKGSKKQQTEKTKKLPSEEAIEYYLRRTNYTRRQLDDSYAIFGDSAYDPIRRIEKNME